MRKIFRNKILQVLFVAGSVIAGLQACKHQPVEPVPPITPPDTIPTGGGGGGCDPDTIYFANTILPILQSNCAKSGCHDANTAANGVILNNYNNIINTGDVRAANPGGSDLYEVIMETDPDKRMPPPPNALLSQEQKEQIRLWIMQGAKNNICNDNCDTTAITFSGTVAPIMNTYCKGCHNANLANGGIRLDNHSEVKVAAASGRLYGAITHAQGFSPMPKGGQKLDDCKIKQIKTWIDSGMPDN